MSYQTIPVIVIVFSAISFVLAVILPLAAIIFAKIKYKMPLYPILFGAVTFVLFVLILETAANNFLIGTFSLNTNIVAYILYSLFAAGLFEETGRLISFSIIERISKKPRTPLTGISYGFGHGGIESLLLVGMTMISNIAFAISVNSGAIYQGFEALDGPEKNFITNLVASFTITPPMDFLMGGIERLIAIPAQLCFSVIMFYAVFAKRKIWLYPVAILAHMITNVPAMLYQTGVIENMTIIESITAFLVAGVIVFTVWVNDKFKGDLTQPAAVLSASEADSPEPEVSESEITVSTESEPEKE
ncbi:MAG: YhfC family intramembrane metalloprotease [Ruminococcus sp.]|jgi:uncharacterized membrane protein YhfC|nr:YhfC family intramembrane metalloprotease [Ruminococcus sp.]